MALDVVAGALGGVPLRHDRVEHLGQDAALAGEGRAVRGHDRVAFAGVRSRPNEVQGIDLERPDQARVEALEVQDDHVRVEAGARLEDVAAAHGLDRVHPGDAGRDHPPPPQLREVEEIEGGDRGGHAVEGHAGQAAPLDRELHEPQPLHDPEGEPGVGPVVLDEALPIFLEEAQDLSGAAVPGQELAFAQDLARDRVQAVVLHAHEGAAQEEDAVEDDAARHACPARPAGREVGAQAQRPRASAELQGHAMPRGEPREDGQVEIDHVPAGEDVWVQLANAPAEGNEQLLLAREGDGALRVAPAGGE